MKRLLAYLFIVFGLGIYFNDHVQAKNYCIPKKVEYVFQSIYIFKDCYVYHKKVDLDTFVEFALTHPLQTVGIDKESPLLMEENLKWLKKYLKENNISSSKLKKSIKRFKIANSKSSQTQKVAKKKSENLYIERMLTKQEKLDIAKGKIKIYKCSSSTGTHFQKDGCIGDYYKKELLTNKGLLNFYLLRDYTNTQIAKAEPSQTQKVDQLHRYLIKPNTWVYFVDYSKVRTSAGGITKFDSSYFLSNYKNLKFYTFDDKEKIFTYEKQTSFGKKKYLRISKKLFKKLSKIKDGGKIGNEPQNSQYLKEFKAVLNNNKPNIYKDLINEYTNDSALREGLLAYFDQGLFNWDNIDTKIAKAEQSQTQKVEKSIRAKTIKWEIVYSLEKWNTDITSFIVSNNELYQVDGIREIKNSFNEINNKTKKKCEKTNKTFNEYRCILTVVKFSSSNKPSEIQILKNRKGIKPEFVQIGLQGLINDEVQIAKINPDWTNSEIIQTAKTEPSQTQKVANDEVIYVSVDEAYKRNLNVCIPYINNSHWFHEDYYTNGKCKKNEKTYKISNERGYVHSDIGIFLYTAQTNIFIDQKGDQKIQIAKTESTVKPKKKVEVAKVEEPKQEEFKPKKTNQDNEAPIIEIAETITVDSQTYTLKGKVKDKSKLYLEANGRPLKISKRGNFELEGFVVDPDAGDQIKIVAIDQWKNKSEKTINIKVEFKEIAELRSYEKPNPSKIKVKQDKNKIAIIIGIEKYKNLKNIDAPYANRDANAFRAYANRALGIPNKNIKVLIDENATRGETLKALTLWLPQIARGKNKDIYIFFAGHGLASDDGKNLYILPQDGDAALLQYTALSRLEIFDLINRVEPNSVTMFFDTCYSGQTRDERMLVAGLRPIRLVADEQEVQNNFTIFTASNYDQTSGSIEEAKHGIFSYYLMMGMQGKADSNQDKKITNGELIAYLKQNVSEEAFINNRQQEPMLSGDPDKVLISYR